ncbi:MAG: hypothetical protein HWE08_04930 [Alphaproteobacteria bacterium]|nr:hypothetical protein [Alphaproteobacteria bacterium]
MQVTLAIWGLAFILLATSAVSEQVSAQGKEAALPVIKDLKLQRSSYPATLSADCEYIDEAFNMQCSFFISRVAAKKSDNRVSDMLMRMYRNRTKAEWQDHPICTTPEVKDIDRHIKVMKIQKDIGKTEEQMIRRNAAPAIKFCDDPTQENYKAYVGGLADETSCSISTSVERVKMRYEADSQTWSGIFTPKGDQKPITNYKIQLDSVTGQVGQRLIFMVTQVLRPKDGGRPQRLIYRGKRSDEKYYCGYVDW